MELPEKSVDLVVGTGQLIRVDEEFSSLFVANPEVADIEVKSPRLMYLTGVGVGETTLFAVDEQRQRADVDAASASPTTSTRCEQGIAQDGARAVGRRRRRSTSRWC